MSTFPIILAHQAGRRTHHLWFRLDRFAPIYAPNVFLTLLSLLMTLSLRKEKQPPKGALPKEVPLSIYGPAERRRDQIQIDIKIFSASY